MDLRVGISGKSDETVDKSDSLGFNESLADPSECLADECEAFGFQSSSIGAAGATGITYGITALRVLVLSGKYPDKPVNLSGFDLSILVGGGNCE